MDVYLTNNFKSVFLNDFAIMFYDYEELKLC